MSPSQFVFSRYRQEGNPIDPRVVAAIIAAVGMVAAAMLSNPPEDPLFGASVIIALAMVTAAILGNRNK